MIFVTKHAVEKYIKCVENVDEKTAKKALKKIVQKGRPIFSRRNVKRHGEWDYIYCYQKVEALVAKKKNGDMVVVTCYGDPAMQKWCRNQRIETRRIGAWVL